MIQVFDDVLPKSDHVSIYNMVTSTYFPWYLEPQQLIEPTYKDKCFKHHQFCHVVYSHVLTKEYVFSEKDSTVRSDKFDFFEKYVGQMAKQYKIQGTLNRIKLNCQYQDNRNDSLYNPIHVDDFRPHTSLLYYSNDSDGDTIYFKGNKEIQRISPKANRLVIAKGPIHHCSSNPKNTELRYVMNSVIMG